MQLHDTKKQFCGVPSILSIIAVLAIVCATLALSGCGGGGGGAAKPGASAAGSGSGKVAAVVKLTGRVAGRAVASTATSTVNVQITISGIYSVDGKPFTPRTTTVLISLADGHAQASVIDVPIGVHHLLTAVADWGSATETVKVIIPEIKEGETENVIADQASTAVADAALYLADQRGTTLDKMSGDTIASIQSAVASLATNGTPFENMTPSLVLAYISGMNVPSAITVSPASATLIVGETLQFTAVVLDGNRVPVIGATPAWQFSAPAAGSIGASGLFTAAGAGAGMVTASYGSLSATAAVTVLSVCKSATDCNDGNLLTIDACVNPSTINASCSHTAIACAADTDCNDNNALTIDTCSNGGAANASCAHASFACNTAADCAFGSPVCIDGGRLIAACVACAVNSDCNDGNALTIDTCSNAGTANASCSHAAMACNTNADCGGGAPVCINGGQPGVAACIACAAGTDCDDNNALTIDTCSNPGTANSACSHTSLICNTNADCSISAPICKSGGTVGAACIACDTNADCGGGAPVCMTGGGANSRCVVCAANTDCDDANPATTDTCNNPGTANASCGHSTTLASSNITTNTTWTLAGSPYILQGQIAVDPGVTLTIQPGVEVRFVYPATGNDFFSNVAALGGIRVDGTLNAIGTATSPIVMRLDPASAPGPGRWGGIYFNSAQGGSVQYVNMDGPAYAINITTTTGVALPPVDHVNITNAAAPFTGTSYHISVNTPAGWQEKAVEHYGIIYQDKRIDLSSALPDAEGRYKVRITQAGLHAAQIDSVALYLDGVAYAPIFATDISSGENALEKISSADNDVINAHEKTFEVEFAAPAAKPRRAYLSLKAREEADQIQRGGVPFTFPHNEFYQDAASAKLYAYTLDAGGAGLNADGLAGRDDALPQPAFVEYARPMTGHPEGYVYGYLKNDSRFLYAALDFTTDNTYDGNDDYASLYVKVGNKLKKFRVSVPETTWGQVGFIYTDKVGYQHKYYEYKIPLEEIGAPAMGEQISYMFDAYGTSSMFNGEITNYSLSTPATSGSFTNISIGFSTDTVPGAISGLYLQSVGNLTLSNITINNSTGDGALLNNVTNSTINGLSISNVRNSATGIALQYSSNITATNLSVNGTNGGPGAFIYGPGNISFTNCAFDQAGGGQPGVTVSYSNTGTGVSFTNCEFLNNTAKGVEAAAANIFMTGSRISGSGADGINMIGAGVCSLITDTDITNSAGYGVNTDGGPAITLDGVYLSGNNAAGAGVADTSTVSPTSDSVPPQYQNVPSVLNPLSSLFTGTPRPISTTCMN